MSGDTEAQVIWSGEGSRPPAPLRYANWLGRPFRNLVDLDEAALVERALRRHPHFAPERIEFREGLAALAGDLDREANLNFVGRLAARQDMLRLLGAQKRILEELDRRPEAADERIQRPVFVVGLPRTGTTILLALLSQDPAHRPLLFWEGLDPVPPRRGSDRRLQKARAAIRSFEYLSPHYQSIHPMGADLPEECVLLFMPFFATPQFDFQYRVPGYINWLTKRGLGGAYRRYRDQLRLLQYYDRPHSGHESKNTSGDERSVAKRWLLKDPAHLLGLDHLVDLFPDACIIQTHRDPLKSLPSNCSLYAHSRILFSDRVDAHELGTYVAEGIWPRALDVALEARESLPAQSFFDLHYADFMKDPIRAIERIYHHFGLDLLESTKESMRSYLARHPRAGDRVHSYSLGQFGLDPAAQRKRYQSYCDRFEIAREA